MIKKEIKINFGIYSDTHCKIFTHHKEKNSETTHKLKLLGHMYIIILTAKNGRISIAKFRYLTKNCTEILSSSYN